MKNKQIIIDLLETFKGTEYKLLRKIETDKELEDGEIVKIWTLLNSELTQLKSDSNMVGTRMGKALEAKLYSAIQELRPSIEIIKRSFN